MSTDGPDADGAPPDPAVEPGTALLDLVAPLWSETKTRQALGGLTAEDLADQRLTGALLGLQALDGGGCAYPVFQFERRGDDVRVKPALIAFMTALGLSDPWSVAALVKTPAPELNDMTPLDWVRQGGSEQILADYARVLEATFSN